MNVPNFLTLLRILMIPLLIISLIEGKQHYAFWVFILAGISDGLDGFLARLLKQKTALGAILDPIADKLLLTTSYLTMAIFNIIPSWLAVFVISRDVIILTGIAVLKFHDKPISINPTVDSKITTFFQLATICFFLGGDYFKSMGWLGGYLLYATAGFTIISGFHYIMIGFGALEDEPADDQQKKETTRH